MEVPSYFSEVAQQCDALAVDAELIHRSLARHAASQLSSASVHRRLAQGMAFLELLSLGLLGTSLYYQHARLYRVWRLRNPVRVRQWRHTSLGSGVAAIFFFAALFMPNYGCMHQSELHRRAVKDVDQQAFEALRYRQRFATLQVWCHTLSPATSSSSDAQAHSQPCPPFLFVEADEDCTVHEAGAIPLSAQLPRPSSHNAQATIHAAFSQCQLRWQAWQHHVSHSMRHLQMPSTS